MTHKKKIEIDMIGKISADISRIHSRLDDNELSPDKVFRNRIKKAIRYSPR
jgi:hypothetical protein